MGINPFPPVVPKTPPGASESAKGGIITITTTGVHGFAVGQTVKIYNVSNNGYNGTATIATVPNSKAFTYIAPEGARPAAPSGRRLRFQH